MPMPQQGMSLLLEARKVMVSAKVTTDLGMILMAMIVMLLS